MKTIELVLVGLFAALTAIGAFIQIPGPVVPFTLQFVFCAFAGMLLGRKLGLYSQLLYVGIGLAGIPVFTKGGGLTYIFIPTFGYLLGFILCATIIGFLVEKLQNYSFTKLLMCVLVGLGAVYIVGIPYLYVILKYYMSKPIDFNKAMAIGFYPFILQDIGLSCIVALVGARVIPSLKRSGYFYANNKLVA